MIGELPAIIPEIEGEAQTSPAITGEHALLIDPRDPFAHGFRL
jgi:proline racemase